MLASSNRINTTVLLICEFVLLSVLIIYKSINATDGYVSADSTAYLSLSQNLLEGNGFFTAGFGLATGSDKKYFAVWPVGYPVLIYLFSVVLKTSVFWSSKIINLICLAFIFLLVKKIGKDQAWIICLVFFLFPILELFTYSWSEIPFVTALLYLLFFINGYINANKQWMIAGILICAIAIFLFRYIGYMSVPLLFFMTFILALRKEYKKAIIVGLVSAVVAITIYLYLQHNKAMTGFITGIDRVPARETFFQFIIMLVIGFYLQFEFIYGINFLPVVIAIGAILIYKQQLGNVFSSFFSKRRFLYPNFKDLLIIAAILYFSLLIYNRRQAFFDNFDTRLLAPGVILISVAVSNFLAQRLIKFKYVLTISLTVIALSSYLVSLGAMVYKVRQGSEIGYKNFTRKIAERYRTIPAGSVLLCANRHIAYMRTDLVLAFPHYEPFNNDTETWSVFLSRVKSHFPQKKIYFFAEDGDGMHPLYDKTIREYISSHPINTLHEF